MSENYERYNTTRGNSSSVEGGHVLRSTGRKDRHSKVYTSKGPRDRRVRLSAHTAIQFYDVQDRLGYDRASKAIDWLLKKAKIPIDKLNEGAAPPPLWLQNDNINPSSTELTAPSGEGDANFGNYTMNIPGFTMPGESFQGEDLGLSLHSFQGNCNNPFQESFQETLSFSQQKELLQSNLLSVNPWNQRSLDSIDQHDSQLRGGKSRDFESPFELGFRVPARIYGEEEPNTHR